MTIHPTARVEDGAVVGEGTSIGPYCIVGPHVVIGANCELIAAVHVTARTTIGDGCTIHPFVSLGTPPQSLSYRGELTRLEIGEGCTIREQSTMNAGTVAGGGVTRVGERGHFMNRSHIGHDCQLGNDVSFGTSATLGGHCAVGDFVSMGDLSGERFSSPGAHPSGRGYPGHPGGQNSRSGLGQCPFWHDVENSDIRVVSRRSRQTPTAASRHVRACALSVRCD